MTRETNETGRRHAGRSLPKAYALWALLGGFGAHRFYVGHRRAGAAMLLLGTAGTALSSAEAGWPMLAGLALLAVEGVWAVADARWLPRWVAACNAA